MAARCMTLCCVPVHVRSSRSWTEGSHSDRDMPTTVVKLAKIAKEASAAATCQRFFSVAKPSSQPADAQLKRSWLLWLGVSWRWVVPLRRGPAQQALIRLSLQPTCYACGESCKTVRSFRGQAKPGCQLQAKEPKSTHDS